MRPEYIFHPSPPHHPYTVLGQEQIFRIFLNPDCMAASLNMGCCMYCSGKTRDINKKMSVINEYKIIIVSLPFWCWLRYIIYWLCRLSEETAVNFWIFARQDKLYTFFSSILVKKIIPYRALASNFPKSSCSIILYCFWQYFNVLSILEHLILLLK